MSAMEYVEKALGLGVSIGEITGQRDEARKEADRLRGELTKAGGLTNFDREVLLLLTECVAVLAQHAEPDAGRRMARVDDLWRELREDHARR